MSYRDRIIRDLAICGGKPIIKGTRITVKLVLDCLTSGMTVEEIVAEYPQSIGTADVYAVIQFVAAASADDELIPLPAAEE
jgi:uncharacterized protein (DUF433 family)